MNYKICQILFKKPVYKTEREAYGVQSGDFDEGQINIKQS